jgi:hypothetical protein
VCALVALACADPSGVADATKSSASARTSDAASAISASASAGGAPSPPTASTAPRRVGPGRAGAAYLLESVTEDGKRALLLELASMPNQLHYRVVDVDTSAVAADLPLTALSTLPLETLADAGGTVREIDDLVKSPAVADDLKKAAPWLAAFPLGAGGRVAAHASLGIAFNGGDWVYLADPDGHTKLQLSKAASYAPWFSPDGKLVFTRRLHGSLDGVEGRYVLYGASVDGKSPAREIPATAALRDGFALEPDARAVRVVASFEPKVKTCVVRVELTPPFVTKQQACLDDREELVDARLSTHGAWATFLTTKQLAEDDPGAVMVMPDGSRKPMKKKAFRFRVVDVETGRVAFDGARPTGTLVAISDAGLAVFSAPDGVTLFDAATKTSKKLANPLDLGLFGRFRNDRELVFVSGDTASVVDLSKQPTVRAP